MMTKLLQMPFNCHLGRRVSWVVNDWMRSFQQFISCGHSKKKVYYSLWDSHNHLQGLLHQVRPAQDAQYAELEDKWPENKEGHHWHWKVVRTTKKKWGTQRSYRISIPCKSLLDFQPIAAEGRVVTHERPILLRIAVFMDLLSLTRPTPTTAEQATGTSNSNLNRGKNDGAHPNGVKMTLCTMSGWGGDTEEGSNKNNDGTWELGCESLWESNPRIRLAWNCERLVPFR